MSKSRFGSLQGPRSGGLAVLLALVVAGCVGSSATIGPSAAPPASPAPESTLLAPGSFGPSPTPESTSPVIVPSTPPSAAPSVAPSEAPSTEPSAGPTPAPTPFAFGDTDKATGLKATMLQVGDWTATTAPTFDVVLTWKTPTSPDTVVRVEGITKCYAPADVTGQDCVTPTTRFAGKTIVLIAHAPASARTVKWTWPAWEEIGEPVATDGPHDFYGIIVTFTTGSTVKVVLLDSSQTCPGCAY
ncbi:MAG TPA: hypothetical protein VID26_05995 [Candidatus Limnocylindrales bacterium]